jgi:hypothetical protein
LGQTDTQSDFPSQRFRSITGTTTPGLCLQDREPLETFGFFLPMISPPLGERLSQQPGTPYIPRGTAPQKSLMTSNRAPPVSYNSLYWGISDRVSTYKLRPALLTAH